MTRSTIRHQPGRATAAVAIAGPARWSPLRPPGDLELAQAVRRWCLTALTSSAGTAAAAADRATLVRIAGRFPTAEPTFGRAALLALTRRPGPGVCGFCRATVTAAALSEPAPNPTTPVLQALLGRPCRRCLARQRTTDHVAAVAAAGLVEERLLDDPTVTRFAARIGYWAHRTGVPAPIVAEFFDALRRPDLGGRRPTGMITSVSGRR